MNRSARTRNPPWNNTVWSSGKSTGVMWYAYSSPGATSHPTLRRISLCVPVRKKCSRECRRATFGELHYRRRDLPLPPEEGRRLVERLRRQPPATLGGMRITGLDDLDGLKLLFGDDGWILFLASGTEPVLRVYSEAPTPDRLDAVMSEALSMIS